MTPRHPDIFTDSQAWQRLHEPSPRDADTYLVRVKHDVVQVFQSMLAALQAAQDLFYRTSRSVEEVEKNTRRSIEAVEQRTTRCISEVDVRLSKRVEEVEVAHDELLDRLFNDEHGAFVRSKMYVDGKLSKVYAVGIGILSSMTTACVLLAVNAFVLR